MFSYTDDAIVTSSPTGRHLSTVIRRPAAIGPLDWNDHADQVCKVLNELGTNAKAAALAEYLLNNGPVYRIDFSQYQVPPMGPTWPFEDQMPLATEPTFASARIAELEKQLDDVTTKLTAAQMLLEKPIEVTADLGASLYYLPKGGTTTHKNRTFKRVE